MRVGADSKTKYNSRYKLNSNEVDDSKVGDNKVIEEKNYQKMFKSKKTIRSLDFFISKTRLTFIKLRKIFVKA